MNRLIIGSLTSLFLSLLCGCASKEPVNAAQEDQTPAKAIVRTFPIPPFFVEDHPNLRYDVPVKNETGKTVRFSHIRTILYLQGGGQS